MKYLIWLDDLRNPFVDPWWSFLNHIKIEKGITGIIWAKTYNEFVYIIQNNSMPAYICFDNDLGQEKEGYDCAKWLVDYCLDNNCKAPDFYIQSDNGPAQDNIRMILNNYNGFFDHEHEDV